MQIRAPRSPDNEAPCSNEWDPGIPKYVFAKNWVLLLYSSPTPSLHSAYITCSSHPGRSGAGARQSTVWVRCSALRGPASLYLSRAALLSALQLLTTAPSERLRSVCDCPSSMAAVSTVSLACPPKEGQESDLTIRKMTFFRGPPVSSSNGQHTKDVQYR